MKEPVIRYRESRISAHHNYLVNDLLTTGFVVGDPNSRKGFWFLADFVPPGESGPQISARLLNRGGDLLLEMDRGRIGENPEGCTHQSFSGGFSIMDPSAKPLLEVRTQNFPLGCLTRIKAGLFDEHGDLRVEPLGESIQVHGATNLVLDTPFTFSAK